MLTQQSRIASNLGDTSGNPTRCVAVRRLTIPLGIVAALAACGTGIEDERAATTTTSTSSTTTTTAPAAPPIDLAATAELLRGISASSGQYIVDAEIVGTTFRVNTTLARNAAMENIGIAMCANTQAVLNDYQWTGPVQIGTGDGGVIASAISGAICEGRV